VKVRYLKLTTDGLQNQRNMKNIFRNLRPNSNHFSQMDNTTTVHLKFAIVMK